MIANVSPEIETDEGEALVVYLRSMSIGETARLVHGTHVIVDFTDISVAATIAEACKHWRIGWRAGHKHGYKQGFVDGDPEEVSGADDSKQSLTRQLEASLRHERQKGQ